MLQLDESADVALPAALHELQGTRGDLLHLRLRKDTCQRLGSQVENLDQIRVVADTTSVNLTVHIIHPLFIGKTGLRAGRPRRFSDINFVAAGKRRDFCRLLRAAVAAGQVR
jgi:hypothetical protein